METLRITVPPESAGERLDKWLGGALPGFSRSRVKSLVDAGHVMVDGRAVKAHRKVATGQLVEVSVPDAAPSRLVAQDIPVDVVYEDADILVVNKPPDMVVHPAAGHAAGTLVNALLHHCGDIAGVGGEMRPGIVHRLDKDTSGLLVIAKNPAAMSSLGAQFRARTVEKEYLALVTGAPRARRGRIETKIARSSNDRKKMAVLPLAAARGREAVTEYAVEQQFEGASLLRVSLLTGRTHQIRVHLAHIGCPVAGDPVYGRKRRGFPPRGVAVPRQMLHAHRLALEHPGTGRRMMFATAIPPDMAAVLSALGATGGAGRDTVAVRRARAGGGRRRK